jgi:ABC-type bacteriocin/lantibiotic exporter with double-glycine peptidase domain
MPLQAVASMELISDYISISKDDYPDPAGTSQSGKDVNLGCKTYHQTKNNTCGPSAIMTLMRYYGRLKEADMAPNTELRIAMEMGANEEGTTMSQVTDWLSNHGFEVSSGTRISAQQIIDNLKQHIPTLISVNHHWILSKGYTKGATPEQDEIYFCDSCCGMTEISAKSIHDMWETIQLQGHHFNFNTGEYVVAVPK